MFKLGPTEMRGQIWDENSRTDIVEILITHQQDVINSLQFTYGAFGDKYTSQTYGTSNGLKFNMVQFNYPEVLTSLSGEYKDGRLASLFFGTNKGTYGPFGKTRRNSSSSSNSSYEEFDYEFNPGRFGGFHGSVDGGCVYAIGVYLKPHQPYTLDDYLEDWMELNRS